MTDNKNLEERVFEELKQKILYNYFPKFQIYELQIASECINKFQKIFHVPRVKLGHYYNSKLPLTRIEYNDAVFIDEIGYIPLESSRTRIEYIHMPRYSEFFLDDE